MIFYECLDCGEKFKTEIEITKCKNCQSIYINAMEDLSSKDFICEDCKIIFEVPLKECKSYWNWKCPQCNHISKGKKSIGFVMPSGKVKIEKIGEYKRNKPSLNYLQKNYGEELHKPYTDFKKKK